MRREVHRGNAISPAAYAALAQEYGTPLFVYDGAALVDSLRRLRAALPAGIEIFYPLKANPNVTVVGLLARHGARALISTLVELRTAVLAGVDPRDIIFLGSGRNPTDLLACVDHRIHAVVVESLCELAELNTIAADAGVRPRVMLRIDPATADLAPHTGKPACRPPGRPDHLTPGIDWAQILASPRLPERFPAVDLVGVHVRHQGPAALDPDVVIGNVARSLCLAERTADATGIRLDVVDVGGGPGVAYFDDERDPDLDRLADGLHPLVDGFRARHPHARLLVESGRFVAASAGTYLTRIRYVKRAPGRWLAVADGGAYRHMAGDRADPAATRDRYALLLNRPEQPATRRWQLSGPRRTPDDMILRDVALPPLRAGDLVGIARSGAYGPTAGTPFLTDGYPAEVLLHQGRSYLVRTRDQPFDLLHRQHLHRFGGEPMDRTQVVEQIRAGISALLREEMPTLDEDAKLAELGMDSTRCLELLVRLEQHGSFEVDGDILDFTVFDTVRTLTEYILRAGRPAG